MHRPLLLLLSSAALLWAEPPAATPARDHVLFIAIDDLNDWVGCLGGHPQASTPHFDRLAARGVLFTNAHCQATICNPSRTSFMSGLRPSTTGVYGNAPAHNAKGRLKAGKDVPWLPLRFQQAGYHTAAAGKLLHHGHQGLGQTLAPQTGQGPYPAKKMNVPAEITDKGIWDYGPWPALEDFTDWRNAQWLVDQIAKPSGENDAPRFFALGFFRPHVPLFAPPEFFDATPKPEDIILAPTPADDLGDLPAIARRMHSRVSFQAPVNWVLEKESRLRELTRAYLACTTAMDHCLGAVIDALDRSPMADNTWIVVFSDHGWHLGEKNHVAKQTLWERSTRVPLVIVPPKNLDDFPRGKRCVRPVELLDLYPTLLEAAGLPEIENDKHLEGTSLLPWLRNPAAPRERPALTTLYAHNHGLRDERYRYIRYADGSEELYDHSNDPHEHHNLIAKAGENPELRAAIDRLAAWIPKEQAGEPDLVLPRNPVESRARENGGGEASWRERLHTPTLITRLGDTWFMVVCWQHRILYHDGPTPDPDLSKWQVLDEALAGPHSITTDGALYVVDDTGRHGLRTYRRRSAAEGGGFELMQIIEGLGKRTHRVHYCAAGKAFHVLASNSQDLYKFVRDGWKLKLESHRPLGFLEGTYTRSFTLHDGHMYFTAGPGIIKARYLDGSYEVVARYPVPRSLSGMNDVFPASDGWWYVTATPQAIVRTRDLAMLADGGFEELQQPLGFDGTPYYISEHDGRLWIPQITQHSGILSFKLDPDGGKPTDRQVLFDFGAPIAADLERMNAFPR